jgi:thioredoxin reductase (NADPH)
VNKIIKNCVVLAGTVLAMILAIYLILVYATGTSFATRQSNIKLDSNHLVKLDNVMPVVIIGSGPAGLAAGVYTKRAGINTLIIEGKKPGGLLTETTYIENWPAEEKILGKDLMAKFKKQNQALGVQFLTDIVERVDFNTWPYQIYTADGVMLNALSVIIATGATPRLLGVPGEQQYWSHGVSSCAVCDAPFYKNKDVIVTGGGDSAAEQVLQLAPHVKSVTMLVRKETLRACKNMQEKLAAISNAHILFNNEIKQIYGDHEQVVGVELFNNQTNSSQNLPINGVFLAIGHDPATQLFKEQLAMDQHGYLLLQAGSQTTSLDGIFAAGEVVDHTYRQAGVAAGDGIKAALDCVSFLQAAGFNADFSQKIEDNYFVPQSTTESNIQKIKTIQEFEAQAVNGNLPAVLDFYTNYCSSCLHMMPFYEAVAQKLTGKMNFFKVDADEAEELIRKLKISRVPTILVYQNGAQVFKTQQTMTKREMIDLFGKYVT